MCNQYSFIALVLLLSSSLCIGQRFKLGLESIPPDLIQLIQNKSVALITDRSAYDQQGRSSLSCLLKEGISVTKLFSADASMDPDRSGPVPFYDVSKLEEECDSLDVFLVDLTDFGLRNALSLTLLAQALSIASQHHKKIIILDRPNPLGFRMEGPLVDPAEQYTQTVLPIPFRHGMTLGEIAWFCNMHYVARPAQLQVVCMKGYNRDDVCATEDESAYHLLELFAEVNPLSLSGTDIMIPTNESPEFWKAFANSLSFSGLSVTCYTKPLVTRLSVSIPDSNRVPSFKTMLYMLDFFKDHAIELCISDGFDALVGTSKMREYLEGDCSFETFASGVNDGLAYFYRKARSSFMYMPLPEVCELAQVRG